MGPTGSRGPRRKEEAGSHTAFAFRRIPTIRTSQELVDTAFHRAAKITIVEKNPATKVRSTEVARVRSVQNSLDAALGKYVRTYPSFDRIDPFYRDLIDLLVDLDRTRKALGAVDWARKQIGKVGDEAAQKMRGENRPDLVRETKSHMYGRVASILKQIDKDLVFLNAARDDMRRLPFIDPDVPTIVVAGFPNVGKSSFIRIVSTAEPEIASYPFTTKGVAIGHFDKHRVRYQIVDTPGLLDRDLDERNDIERQAILALQHLADVIVFMLDPSEYCGYPMAEQTKLLKATQATFPDVPILVAENKVDLKRPEKEEGRFQVSTATKEGVDALVDAAVEAIAKAERAVQ